MAKLPISVCIIAKNEEKYIETCLKHLGKYNWEIVVVDTGSTDRTKEIAMRYTGKVYDFAWVNDFSAARNFAVSKASNNWILVLDGDEYLQKLNVNEIRKCMQQNNNCVGIIRLRNVYTLSDGSHQYQYDTVPRFYNKNFFEYKFRIHEQITPKNATNLEEVVLYTFEVPAEVDHYGYDIPKEEMLKKQERNLALLEESIGDGHMDDYLLFQIGQSNFVLERYAQAAEAYDKCFALNTNMEKNFMPVALNSYAETLLRLGMDAQACALLTAHEAYLTTANHQYLYGKAVQGSGDELRALLIFIKLTRMSDFESLGEDVFDVYGRLLYLCETTGNQNKKDYFRQELLKYAEAHGRTIVFQ